jgi:hypothetical protein
MASYELRAELRRRARIRSSHTWHVVFHGCGEALCGRNLDGDIPEVRPIGEAHLVILAFRCRACFELCQE